MSVLYEDNEYAIEVYDTDGVRIFYVDDDGNIILRNEHIAKDKEVAMTLNKFGKVVRRMEDKLGV